MSLSDLFVNSVKDSHGKIIDAFVEKNMAIERMKKVEITNFVDELCNLGFSYEENSNYLKSTYGLVGPNYLKSLMLKIGIFKAKEEDLTGDEAIRKINNYAFPGI